MIENCRTAISKELEPGWITAYLIKKEAGGNYMKRVQSIEVYAHLRALRYRITPLKTGRLKNKAAKP